jgi:hypothetical protein
MNLCEINPEVSINRLLIYQLAFSRFPLDTSRGQTGDETPIRVRSGPNFTSATDLAAVQDHAPLAEALRGKVRRRFEHDPDLLAQLRVWQRSILCTAVPAMWTTRDARRLLLRRSAEGEI